MEKQNRRPRTTAAPRRSAAGASRLHSGVPAERRGARSARERPEGREGRRTVLFGLPPPPEELRDSGQRADAWRGAHGSTIRPTDALAPTGARDLRERAAGAGPVRQRKPGRRAAAR